MIKLCIWAFRVWIYFSIAFMYSICVYSIVLFI